ncbi:MAG: hypothetical protein FWG10_09275 [Eubacteriaceae bacterium]|nr:hypothetical protein [Eubacteriaceae bacterium]
MGYYRAALAAANAGNLTGALRLARLSIAFGEEAENAPRLIEIISGRMGANSMSGPEWGKLRTLAEGQKYMRAQFVKLPESVAAYNAKGLIYAQLGFTKAAIKQFCKALAMDTGNILAKQALGELGYL